MENSNNKNDLIFQNYLVIFFDLLGQREALREIISIPVSEPEKTEFLELVKKSIGSVLKIRHAFKSYFDGAKAYTPNIQLVATEYRQEFIESQKTKFHHYELSDAIVIAVPLINDNENCTAINGVFSALTASCAVALLALSMKIAVRAGIDVGVGVQLDDRDVYGPALERAVRIEGQLAEYPRLVVGRELISYLSWVENQTYKTRQGEIAVNMAKLCKKLMVQDTDGRIMLDYLGQNIKEVFENKIKKETVLEAWNFVNDQHIKYIKQNNDRLAPRYFRMIRYFKSRLKLWDI
jgi:hypothetical protein